MAVPARAYRGSDGALGVLRAARSWGWPGAGLLLVQGVGGLGAGLLLLLQPALTAPAVLVGVFAVVVGAVNVAEGLRLRRLWVGLRR